MLIDGTSLIYGPRGIARIGMSLLRAANDGIFDNWGRIYVLVQERLQIEDLPSGSNIEYVPVKIQWPTFKFYTFDMPRIIKSLKISGPVVFLGESRCCLVSLPFIIVVTEVQKSKPKTFYQNLKTLPFAQRMKHQLSYMGNEWRTKRCLPKANRLICISQETRHRLLQHYHVNSLKVDVVYPCVEPTFSRILSAKDYSIVKKRINPSSKGYILFISSGDWRENHKLVLNAYRLARNKGVEQKLVICGARGEHLAWIKRWAANNDLGNHCQCLGFISDEKLAQLYAECSVYVHMSTFEGFGIQVLEAMTCGAPIIHSKIEPLLEIGGDATLTVACDDLKGFVQSLVRICKSQELQAQMSQASFKRAKLFDESRFRRGFQRSLEKLNF